LSNGGCSQFADAPLDERPECWHSQVSRPGWGAGMPGSESIFCVPHPDPGDRLIGREKALQELERTLRTGAGPTLLTALQGTGGIGKTELAARYCWTRRRHHPGGIVWLNMADPAHAVSELVNWAERLRLEVTDASDRAKANAVLGRVRSTDSSGCFR
jgi:hypothetical protein